MRNLRLDRLTGKLSSKAGTKVADLRVPFSLAATTSAVKVYTPDGS
jgi:hypothetical protein